MDAILKHVAQYISLTPDETDFFLSVLEERFFAKKEFLLQEGKVATGAAFVLSGYLRAYSTDANGSEHILQFAPPDWWITDMYSYISGQAAHLFIDAPTETHALVLSKTNQNALFARVPKFERYFRILVENSLVANRQRVLDNLELDAKQRYAKFCKTYPALVNSVAQKSVAAYIGVTPEFLSKMKAEYWREQ